ncbi:MAG TPA: polynucleotide kinase-phosphatase [Actinomycetota bacterium]|nr:polynucleotide kinase-phosphatase [Actinomycetota bacterium]
MSIQIPDLSLVALVGASGSGKSTFAAKHFLRTEVLSSDFCRGLVADDENDQEASSDAFDVLYYIAGKRLEAGRLVVVDATNVQRDSRKPLVELARRYHCVPVAIVLDLPEKVCLERNRGRDDRTFGPHVIGRQIQQLRRSLRGLEREGFRNVFVLPSVEEVESATIERRPLWVDRRIDTGPFDIVGDVHGCCDELEELLGLLGYEVTEVRPGAGLDSGPVYAHPEGRRAVFLGDLVDRGPRVCDTLRLVRNMVGSGSALCVPGNHDVKLVRKLRGRDVAITHGLDRTLAEIDALPDEERDLFRKNAIDFLDGLISHYVLDEGRLVVAHAGMKQELAGRASRKVRDFALYGETTGETDEFGLPVRYEWAAEYRGQAKVVYGHTPVPESEWLNRTINIDTGCVFGGRLTALRYPERELVSVAARRTYSDPVRPFPVEETGLSAQQASDDLLDIDDVMGRRIVATELMGNVTIREENAAAALEAMSRFAVDPRWLVYLPPAISPSETAASVDLLEHPKESFDYYRKQGVPKVVCQEKHMGSRAVLVVCRDHDTGRTRFGLREGGWGIGYTRTGRRFFDSPPLESAVLERVRTAMQTSGLWDELGSDWVVLDCEVMPWSFKAQDLLRRQYAAVGTAARVALGETDSLLREAEASGIDVSQLLDAVRERLRSTDLYAREYGRYCWGVEGADDLKVAPFHILASEGAVHADRDHLWHMSVIQRLSDADPGLLVPTSHRVVDVGDQASERTATEWWEELTSAGGEGMVVKPLDFVVRSRRGLVQPALKCRGREYLRIIYGPEYTLHLDRLRSRSLGPKRSLALREFTLGLEALSRFVDREPLRRVHECVFGVLALEAEPVDPRL